MRWSDRARRLRTAPPGRDVNSTLLMITFRIWLVELPIAAVNYFVLMRRVYEPRWGQLRAHQIGMATRVLIIAVLAYVVLDHVGRYTTLDLLVAGAFWMALWLAFEWCGSLLLRRPVHEIVVGWHVERGYMWPYVLLAYLIVPLLVGVTIDPAR
jgi:hypothetical protein